jgi:hypothetical protein
MSNRPATDGGIMGTYFYYRHDGGMVSVCATSVASAEAQLDKAVAAGLLAADVRAALVPDSGNPT